MFDNKFVNIFEALHDGVLVADQSGVVQYVNASYLRITNTKIEEILNQPLEKTRPGSKLAEVIRSGIPIRHLRRKVGDSEYIANLVPIFEDGKISGGVSISSEIQDVKELFKQLKESETIISQLQDTVNQYNRAKYRFEDIVGDSSALAKVKAKAQKFSKAESSVLIYGESGTGKELFAQSIHNESPRGEGPFVAVNCATLSGDLLESELFGYIAGTFTGANKNGKMGLFQSANGGTIFLDEIGELEIRFQAKLLRALQEKKIRPLGAVNEIPINVRIISATNQNLLEMIKKGTFREDLYYRLSVFELEVPPLRERKEDILPLVAHFSNDLVLSEGVRNVLEMYDWPGNIRELRNTIQFCSELRLNEEVILDDLPKKLRQLSDNTSNLATKPLNEYIREKEREYILDLLDIHGSHLEGKKKVSELLGISIATLYNKLNHL